MPVQWNILGVDQPGIGQHFLAGMQAGQQQRQQHMQRNALQAFARDPDSPEAMEMMIQADPATAIRMRQEQQQRQQAEHKERRADLPMMSRLLDYAQDPQSYQQAREIAQNYGIDISQIPETYDPAWISQQRQVLKTLQSPEAQEALSGIGKQAADMGFRPGTPEFNAKVNQLWQVESSRIMATQPGGGVARVDPVTGKSEFLIAPNDGSHAPGAPAGGAPPPPPEGFVIDGQGGAPQPGARPFP